ncbi:MAG TPA: protein-disulfide reductase DsbD domain-containing protein [Terracidiphilus sp.]|nr:protein-disulfide reductase DsbD domain-containing protein [Terracidiphilus sp.]
MTRRIAAALLLAAACAAQAQQMPSFGSSEHSLGKSAAVEYLFPEQVTLTAGKASAVALHFRIAPGLHINSHAPKDAYLIPTVLAIPAGAGVVLKDAHYPDGVDMALPSDPRTKLNVYTGEFVIDTHLVAEKGNHLVQAKLRYQACDNNACMPPKTATVAFDVIGN